MKLQGPPSEDKEEEEEKEKEKEADKARATAKTNFKAKAKAKSDRATKMGSDEEEGGAGNQLEADQANGEFLKIPLC